MQKNFHVGKFFLTRKAAEFTLFWLLLHTRLELNALLLLWAPDGPLLMEINGPL